MWGWAWMALSGYDHRLSEVVVTLDEGQRRPDLFTHWKVDRGDASAGNMLSILEMSPVEPFIFKLSSIC